MGSYGIKLLQPIAQALNHRRFAQRILSRKLCGSLVELCTLSTGHQNRPFHCCLVFELPTSKQSFASGKLGKSEETGGRLRSGQGVHFGSCVKGEGF